MKIIIQVKNLDLTEELKNFVEEKFIGLKKFIDILKEDAPEIGKSLAEVFVEVEKETEHHKKGKIYSVQARIVLPGKSLIAWSKADSPMKAVDLARDEMKIEIEKYKFKNVDKNRRKIRKAKEDIEI
jgi:ribosomal subunit interface protein